MKMRRVLSLVFWVSLLSLAASAQLSNLSPSYKTPNLGLGFPPHNYAGWDLVNNDNFNLLDSIFSGTTGVIWKPRLVTGQPFTILDTSGNPIFKVDLSGNVTVYGNLTCQGTGCGNGSTGGGITTAPSFSLATGSYTVSQSLVLTAGSGASISWCTTASGSCAPNTSYTGAITINATETVCALATVSGTGNSQIVCTGYVISSSGSQGGGTISDPGSNIGTVNHSGLMTDGSIPFKTCYVGGSVCSGGVGTNAPSSAPGRTAGLSTPNASSGTANAVASHTLSTAHPAPAFTDALWTTTNSGIGVDTTSTNWYRSLYMKANFAAGKTHIEFDTYSFGGGWDWMWGTQCNNTKNIIQYDNQGNGWVDTPIPCSTLYDGNWHHVKQTFHRDLASTHNCASGTAPCQWWDDIVIDNVTYVIGKSLPATTTTWQGGGGQMQLDMEPTTASSGSPATDILYVDTDLVQAGDPPADGGTNPGGNGGSTAGTGELDSFNFDSGTPTSAGLTAVGSPTTSTSNFHSSPNSGLFPAGNNYFTDTLSSPTSVIYTRQYVYVSTISSSSVMGFLRMYHGGAEVFAYYIALTSGTVTGVNIASGSTTAGGGTIAAGGIHMIETYTKISPTAGQYIIKIDGSVTYTSASNLNTGSTTVDTVWFGQLGNTAPTGWGNLYMDNVDFSATGWIGPI